MEQTYTIDQRTTVQRVVLKVLDLQRQTAFYENIIGLTIEKKMERTVYLGVGDGQILLELRQTAEKEQPAKSTGLFHLALLLPNRQAFATKFFEVLRNKETVDSPVEQANRFPHFERILPIAKLDSASDHGYSEAFYMYDLEGNGIEIYADRPKEQWAQYPQGSHPLNFKELAELAHFETDGKLPVETVIGHVHLRVENLEETLAFYNDVLGFESQVVMEDVFFVSAGGYHHHIAGNVWSGENIGRPLPIHTGLQFVQIEMADEVAFQTLKNHVKQQIPMQDLETSFLVTDPSGNDIVFVFA